MQVIISTNDVAWKATVHGRVNLGGKGGRGG